jgi:hypothetical protein
MGFVVLAQDYAVKGSGFIAYNLEKNLILDIFVFYFKI